MAIPEQQVTRAKTNKIGTVLGGPVPSRGELDRGQRALAIVEKQMDLGERAGKLLRTDAVKAEWSGFLRTLNAELKRLPSVTAAAVAVDLKLDANRVEDIQNAVARCIEAMRERLLDLEGRDDDGEDDDIPLKE